VLSPFYYDTSSSNDHNDYCDFSGDGGGDGGGEEAIERSSNGIGGPLQHFASTMQPFFEIH
jgi:hypothetical protein